MNISYNWLKQYININQPIEEIGEVLTAIGLEVGSIKEVQTIKGGLEGLVVGQVLSCEKHPNADKLSLTSVDIGRGENLQIVCGAPNVASGQKVVVATIGTILYAGDDSFTIKRSKIRGIESMGMICAEDEIGLGNSHDGIIVLPEETPIGQLAKDYYGIKSDYLIEIDITPNRVDATSHYGVARDLAAYYAIRDVHVSLTKPDVSSFRIDNTNLSIPVFVENQKACPRYSALTISNVEVKESPAWLKESLTTIGLRPINNIVDATNYVLHEMGQPLHAFDADKIRGQEVYVKNVPEGSPFKTLDGIDRKLSAEDLMICDAEAPMCIGGVFGGHDSGVTEKTKNVFLESAYFNPVNIRKTARRHVLNTDASFRFERGCDPTNTIYILKRCALLIKEVAGGEISSEIVDEYAQEVKPVQVVVPTQKINTIIGKAIERDYIEQILGALEMTITSRDENSYTVKVPVYRVDVQRDVDVIEDILRIYGYNNIQIGENLKSTLSYSRKPDSFRLQNLISEQLTAQGFHEIMNNSLTKGAYYAPNSVFSESNSVKILNPLSNDLNVMRQTLLFGGLESIAYNINRKNANLKFYEFGNCYNFNADKKKDNHALAAYKEDYHLGIWITGQKNDESWSVASQKSTVYELKAYVENIFRRMGIKTTGLTHTLFQDDVMQEAIAVKTFSGKLLAIYGLVHPSILKTNDIAQDVFYANLYWNIILKETGKNNIQFKDIPKYPAVKRDLALLIDKNIHFSEIETIAFETEKKILKDVRLFDVYEGENLEKGKKSYAVSFLLQDTSKTLTDNQIDKIMQKLQLNFERKLGAKLR